jgi:cytochrome bd-type quinol oxidase subunit 2
MKIFIVVMLLAVLSALAVAGVLMLRKGRSVDDRHRAMARALALRVALSVVLFLCVLLAWQLGWIRPSGVPIGR